MIGCSDTCPVHLNEKYTNSCKQEERGGGGGLQRWRMHENRFTLMQPTTVRVRGDVSCVTKMVAYMRTKLKKNVIMGENSDREKVIIEVQVNTERGEREGGRGRLPCVH